MDQTVLIYLELKKKSNVKVRYTRSYYRITILSCDSKKYLDIFNQNQKSVVISILIWSAAGMVELSTVQLG